MPASAENAALLERFYSSFAKGDAAGMNATYAPGVTFSDPVFGELHGDRARAMWTMLCGGMRDFSLTYEVLDANEDSGHGRCVANYLYSATGKKVRNEIDGTFAFKDGAIVRHADAFDLAKWAAQALGPMGVLLGWTPFVQNKIRTMAQARLNAYINKT